MIITAFPILIPFAFMILLITIPSVKLSKFLAIAVSFIMLITSFLIFNKLEKEGILVLQVGGWKAPFGITLAIDYLSALMLIVSSVIILAVAIYSYTSIKQNSRESKFYIFFFS